MLHKHPGPVFCATLLIQRYPTVDVSEVKIVTDMDLMNSIISKLQAVIVSRVEQVTCYKEGIQRIQAVAK